MIKKGFQILKKSIFMLLLLVSGVVFGSMFNKEEVKAVGEEVRIEQEATFDGQVDFTNGYYYGFATYEAFKNVDKSDEYFLCIDKTTPMYNGTYTSEAFSGEIDNNFGLGKTKLTDELKEKLSLISYFGYQENFSKKRLVLSQHLVWDAIHPGHDMTYTGDLTLEDFKNHKADVYAKIERYKTKPSFDNTTVKIKAGESVVLEDSNHSLDTINFENKDGFTFEVIDNSHLKVTASNNASSTNVRQRKNINPKYQYESLVYRKPNSQVLAKFGIVDPLNTRITFNVEKAANIKIIKVDAETNKKLAGVVFETSTKEDFSSDVYELTTNENGEVSDVWNRGNVVIHVREKTAPAGYVKSNEIKKVNLEVGKTTEVTFTNNKVKGNVKVVKIDTDTKEKLAGVTFELYQNDKAVATGITNADGEVVFKNIEYGTYQLVEKATKEGYVLNGKTQEVVISQNGVEISKTITNTKIKGNIELTKFDSATKKELANAVFELRKDGKKLQEGTTDINGRLVFRNIEYGTYTLVETKAPAGYELNQKPIPVTIKNNYEVIKLDAENKPVPEIKTGAWVDNNKVEEVAEPKERNQLHEKTEVEKLVKDNEYKIVVKVVRNCDNAVVYTENHEFKATGDKYEYQFNYELNGFENSCGVSHEEELYVKDKKGNWKLVHEHNKNHKDKKQTVNFKKYKEIIVKKIDANDKTKALAGAIFALYRDGKEIAKATTNAEGIAKFEKLIEGVTYELKEVEAPAGYLISKEVKTIVLNEKELVEKETVFEMPNTLLPIVKKCVETNAECTIIYVLSSLIATAGLFLLRKNKR